MKADSAPKPARPVIPFIVLAVSLLLTAAAAIYVADSAEAKDRARFDNAVERTQSAVRQRIDTYVNMLRGGAGLFATSGEISREGFENYVARLDLATNFPGVQGVGISARLIAEALDAGLKRMRTRERFPDFQIKPAGTRSEYYPIIFLEPLDDRNRRAIGFDLFHDPTCRAAMEQARDSGQPAITGKVVLVHESDDGVKAGFYIFVPIYHRPTVPPALDDRRLYLAGFCYAPFRADDFFTGVFGTERLRSDMSMEVYDGKSTDDDAALLHRSAVSPDHQPHFARTDHLQLPGRAWTVTYRSEPDFESMSARGYELPVIAVGGILSFVLFALTFAQATARRRSDIAARELSASESKFRRLADANLIGVVFSDLDGAVTDGNDEYFRIIGHRREEVLAGRVRWNQITPPEWVERDQRAVDELKATGVCVPFEKEYLLPDGTRRPVLVGVAMLEGSSNQTVAMILDLTARKQAEQALRSAKEAADRARAHAEEASRLKDEFLATVSHELRTPLNAIFGWAQLLRAGHGGAEELAHGLETIERSSRVQAQLIEDLLDVSRIVAGKLRLEVQSVQLAPVIEAAIASVRPAADAKRVKLIPILDAYVGPVSGDPHRLQQIVWNLLANAVKFTPTGGEARILLQRASDDSHQGGQKGVTSRNVRADKKGSDPFMSSFMSSDGSSGDYAAITVTDTGIGVAHDFLPHLFERFRQADPSSTRAYGGLGLGLAIVRHLVELHGGTVEAHSEGENKGATFTVKLPIAIAHVAHHRSAPPADADHQLQGVRALIVEDDPVSSELVVRMLRQRGAQVTATASAADAIETFAKSLPDVVISDIGMPHEDGYSLLGRIRALPADRGGKAPVIALTALARPEDRRKALLAGFQMHLSKPVDVDQLVAAVAQAVNQSDHSA